MDRVLDKSEHRQAEKALEHSGRSPVEGLLHKLAQLRHSHDGKRDAPADGSNSSTSSSSERRNAHATASTSGRIPSEKAEFELLEMVYRARVRQTGEEVAVKLVDLEKLGASIDLVIEEVLVMKRTQHRCILPLHAAFVDEHFLWMVMPLVDGGSLEKLLKSGYPKGLQEVEVACIMRQVLEALAHLHSRGILHRDIKASNILVGRTDGVVRLSDLGVAAKLERRFSAVEPHRYAELTRRNTFIGSPAYMAPEVLCIEQQGYGLPADMYSFGVTLVEAALGHTPYVNQSLQEIAISKLNADAQLPMLSVDAHGRRFSEEMGDVVAQCLQRRPEDRPSAAHLLRHRFFRGGARDPEALVRALWAAVPEGSTAGGPSSSDAAEIREEAGGMPHAASTGWLSREASDKASLHAASDLPDFFDAEHASQLLKRLLLHRLGTPGLAAEQDSVPLTDVLAACCKENATPWLLATAMSMCKGMFFGLGELRGVGLQHIHGQGFVIARIPGTDGLPVWSGPSYLDISSIRAGLGVGRVRTEICHILPNEQTLRMFKEGHIVQGVDMPLTDFDEDSMSVQSVREFMAAAADEGAKSGVITLRAREGLSLNLLRLLGAAQPDAAANKRIYGKEVAPADILSGRVPPPSAFAFKGFAQLVDDLHALEALCADGSKPPAQQGMPRSDSRGHARIPGKLAYSHPRGFHRYASSGKLA